MAFVFSSMSASSLEISDFKSGLMCGTNHNKIGDICLEQTDIKITGNSTCMANQKIEICTWYGFSFNYTNALDSDLIQCKYKVSVPTRLVNIDRVMDESTTEGTYSFSVKSGDGFFINPQYSIYSSSNVGKKKSVSFVCSYNNAELFKYQINLETI